jgi:hypothetical protein
MIFKEREMLISLICSSHIVYMYQIVTLYSTNGYNYYASIKSKIVKIAVLL